MDDDIPDRRHIAAVKVQIELYSITEWIRIFGVTFPLGLRRLVRRLYASKGDEGPPTKMEARALIGGSSMEAQQYFAVLEAWQLIEFHLAPQRADTLLVPTETLYLKGDEYFFGVGDFATGLERTMRRPKNSLD
ncbi:MAG TPA: hypothetical protein VN495_03315 [Candidatus Paceibacterota bacterium]|nr:hypothetical protein [Candidatus Paceibacterota bacterium]